MGVSNCSTVHHLHYTTFNITTGAYCISKVANRIQNYLKLLQVEQDDHAASDSLLSAREMLCRELQLYKLELDKALYMSGVATDQVDEYLDLGINIDIKVQETEKEIQDLAEELRQEQLLRKHKEECEVLAGCVNLVPSKPISLGDIEKMEEKISQVKEQVAAKERLERKRANQFELAIAGGLYNSDD